MKLSNIPLTAIAKVVDYLEDDEENHYRGERNHIVHSVRRLEKFLYTIDPNNPLERMRTGRAERMERQQKRIMRKLGVDYPNQA
jgi:hypothetical protein